MHNYPTKDCPGSSRFLSIFNIPDKFVLLLHNYATVVRLGLIDGAPLQTGETGKKKKFYGVRVGIPEHSNAVWNQEQKNLVRRFAGQLVWWLDHHG